MRFIKFFGSLFFAVFLIGSLVAILTLSTVLESIFGTPFVQRTFYRAVWFNGFLSLVALNIVCSALSRFPYKKHHVGFVLTHFGILILLLGSLLSRLYGVEGQMTLFETQEKSAMLKQGFRLDVSGAGEHAAVDLKSHGNKLPYRLPAKTGVPRVTVVEAIENARVQTVLREGNRNGIPRRAVNASLSSERAGIKQDITLIEKDPSNPHSFFLDLGPAHFELVTGPKSSADGRAALLVKRGEETASVELGGNSGPVPLGSTGLTISGIRYYPHAKVDGGKLVDSPSDTPFNPAIEFEVSDEHGRKESHTKFHLFPDFSSVRGGKAKDAFGLETRVLASEPEEAAAAGPSFEFRVTPDNEWSYRSRSSHGDTSGPFRAGDTIETGWMDMTIKIKALYENAVVEKKVSKGKNGTPGVFALRLAVEGREEPVWVTDARPASEAVAGDRMDFRISPTSFALPFSLTLKDFRKIDYPGTTNAASFESDVALTDAPAGVKLDRTIQMNRPLDYKGYRIFQSSYVQDEELGEASVFTVTKNPGIRLIYGGAIIVLIGVILLFYWHPFFNPAVVVK